MSAAAFWRVYVIILAGLVAWVPRAAAAESNQPDPSASPAQADTEKADQNAPDDSAYDRHWYFAFGSSNFHPHLDESEGQINRQMNHLLDWLPAWKDPITFKEWSREFRLWDITFGVGRDVTPHFSWMTWAGGAAATVKNNDRYGPIRTDIRFSRFTTFFTLQGYWYPWEKVDYDAVAGEHGMDKVKAAFTNAKPYLSLATGYVYMHASADGKFKLPLIGSIYQQSDEYRHNMYQVSPRLGLEIPVGKNNSITTEALYYFIGPEHAKEYNGPSINFMFKHRF